MVLTLLFKVSIFIYFIMINGSYVVSGDRMPAQNVSLKTKLEKPSKNDGEQTWAMKCMDALHTIGRKQFDGNLRFIENYEMIKGRFIPNHYFTTEGYTSLVTEMQAQFELPNYLRHYDIISQVINTLSGEWQKRPDSFKVRQYGDDATNEYLRTKTELTKQYVFSQINTEIDKRLATEGIDVNKQDFASQEEQQQYQQQVDSRRQELTPIQIQKYMDTDFLTQAEIWGQHQMEYDREVYNLPEKEKIEFEDMLIADRCFRHFYITPTGYNQETWNPVNTFFHKSPDIIGVEDGDYVGRIFNISLATVIDRYGHLMTKDELDTLVGEEKENKTKWNDSKFDWVYNNYMVPFKDYPDYDLMRASFNTWPRPVEEIPTIDANFFAKTGSANIGMQDGYYFVIEAYWKTQKQIYKITYFDEEVGNKLVKIVDENFIIPDWLVESKNVFAEDQDINTYVRTTVNEVWKGIKICTSQTTKLKKDIYLDVRPNDFQFKGDLNIYGCKLPVCGQVFSVRNSVSMALVDMMKPYQILYNVAMNQLYQLAEKEIGVFMVMDVNMMPNNKDWGGEEAWDKWMLIAKHMGLLPADTTPNNISNSLAALGGYLPKIIDLNLAGQMVSRMNIAKFAEEQGLKQVGFNQYRTGDFASTTTATGVKQGQEKSYSQTESYFTNFSNYLRRCGQMQLGIAQYVASQKDNTAFTYTKSDLSRGFVKTLQIDFLLADLGVLVSNNQENLRQLEMMRQYALENNTSTMSPVNAMDIILMNNPHEIRREIEVGYKEYMSQQQQASQLKQQELQQKDQANNAALQEQARQFDAKLENNLDVERIRAGAQAINGADDIPEQTTENNSAEAFKQEDAANNHSLQLRKLALEENKARLDAEQKEQGFALQREKILADIQIQDKETETATILKGKQQQNQKKK